MFLLGHYLIIFCVYWRNDITIKSNKTEFFTQNNNWTTFLKEFD
jgi:hypothetical protein